MSEIATLRQLSRRGTTEVYQCEKLWSANILPVKGSTVIYTTGGKPEFSCTASMLEACGYGLWNFVDPAGRFDLIEVAPDLTEIARIETVSKQLVSTNNYVQGQFLAFSPDEALIYTQQYNHFACCSSPAGSESRNASGFIQSTQEDHEACTTCVRKVCLSSAVRMSS